MKLKLNQIFKLIFLIFLTNISNLYAHNFTNGGCVNHCEVIFKEITNENKLKNAIDQIEIDNNNNSCLNKSLCRG
tara:strand:- start:560 stop:784 length:225 start_codon:yes stop_codon:yes gene_type:complete